MQNIKQQATTSSSYMFFLNSCAAHPTPFFVVHSILLASEMDLASPSIQQSGKQHANAPTRNCAVKKRRPWIVLGATSRTLGKPCTPMLLFCCMRQYHRESVCQGLDWVSAVSLLRSACSSSPRSKAGNMCLLVPFFMVIPPCHIWRFCSCIAAWFIYVYLTSFPHGMQLFIMFPKHFPVVGDIWGGIHGYPNKSTDQHRSVDVEHFWRQRWARQRGPPRRWVRHPRDSRVKSPLTPRERKGTTRSWNWRRLNKYK